ncbi:MAG: hypothetical protein JNK05_24465 [Myxococcales bacterium]|nr:hypothetical protein [Myxococcales bacterium]
MAAVSSRSRLVALACVVFALVLGSCKPPPPQIMLRIETDIPQGPTGVLNALTIELINPDTGLTFFSNRIVLTNTGDRKLPGDFAVSWNGRYPIFDTRVTAEQKDPNNQDAFRPLFTVRAIATFPRNDAVTLWIYLANRCLIEENRLCPSGFTCGRLGCEPETRGELVSTRMDASMPEVMYVPPVVDGGTGGCPAGQAPCTGRCVDLQTDSDHCGVCGRSCAGGANVVSGRCTLGACAIAECRPGFRDCDGNASNGCEVDISMPANCGACGRTCTGTQVCTMAGCADSCPSGQMLCSGACVDLQTNANHCGMCGNACPAGPRSTPVCAAGRCQLQCEPSYANCDSNASNGCEVNTSTDPNHCTMCGMRCPSGGANTVGVCARTQCAIECAPGYVDPDMNLMNGCVLPTSDAGTDSAVDSGIDSGIDSGVDAGIDARADTGVDAGVDVPFDMRTDLGVDTGVDARIDAGVDTGDAGACVTGERCVSSVGCYAAYQANCPAPGAMFCIPSSGMLLPAGTACQTSMLMPGSCTMTGPTCASPAPTCTNTLPCRGFDPCRLSFTVCDMPMPGAAICMGGAGQEPDGTACETNTIRFGRCRSGVCTML